MTSQILDDNGDSRSTYRDDAENGQYGGSFPLSQMSLVSTDDFLPESARESGGEDTDDQIRQTFQRNNTNSISGGINNSSLQRKPSFLEPGSHYDGGGFQFGSGLSQE